MIMIRNRFAIKYSKLKTVVLLILSLSYNNWYQIYHLSMIPPIISLNYEYLYELQLELTFIVLLVMVANFRQSISAKWYVH